MNNLTGNTVIVTGCTGGVGKAVCKLLAARGAIIIGISRKNDDLLEEELKKVNPENSFLPVDLSIYNLCEKAIKIIHNRYQKIDILINCAGSIIPGQFEKLNAEEIDSIIKNNLYSVVYSVKAILPYMFQQHSGKIIVIGSLGGIIPIPYEAIYSSVKFAVRGFSLSLAEELKETGVKLSLISPGSIKTKMLDIEAMDEESAISFVQKPMKADKIAWEVLSVICKPKTEIILPKSSALTSLIVNQFSLLFSLLYPILDWVGKRRQRKYQPTLQPPSKGRGSSKPFSFGEEPLTEGKS